MTSPQSSSSLGAAVAFALLTSTLARSVDAQAQTTGGPTGVPVPADAPDASVGRLQDVYVTATRRAESALSVPYNISATTEQQLENAGVTDFSKLAEVVPGLVYNGGGIREGGTQNGFILRGLNTDRTSTSDLPSLTVAPVAVYIDDTPIFTNLHLTDIARVEVLRGPQGTLYGNGSLGGTIRFLFNEPDPRAFMTRAQAEASETDHAGGPNYTLDGVLNAPITDSLALRMSGGHAFVHGFINARNLYVLDGSGMPILQKSTDVLNSLPVTTAQNDVDDADTSYLHVALGYKRDGLKVLLSFHHQEETASGQSSDTKGIGQLPTAFSSAVTPGFRNDGFDALVPPVYGNFESGIFLREPYQRRLNLESIEVAQDLGFATLTSSTSYFDNESAAVQDLTSSYQTNLGSFYVGFPRLAVPSSRDIAEQTFAEELRLVSQSTMPLRWVMGAFAQIQHQQFNNTDQVLGWNPFATALFGVPVTDDRAFVYDRDLHFRDLALFGELGYFITERWQVTGGVRGFNQHLKISTLTELPICGAFCSNNGTDPLGTTTGEDESTHRKVLWKLNSSYQLMPDVIAYVTASQGFRRGGANALPTTGNVGQPLAFVTFQPDTVRNYEAGVKGRPRGTLEVTADIFQIDWDRPQANILTPIGGFYAAVNGDTARSRGAELSVIARVLSPLTLSASYAYTDAKLTSNFVVAGTDFGVSGTRLPGVPKQQGSLAIDLSQPLGAGCQLSAHVDGSYRGGVVTSLPGSLGGAGAAEGGFALWNANGGFDFGSWRVRLFVDNVSNIRGVTTSIPAAAIGTRDAINWLARPRTVGVRVNYEFGGVHK